MRVTLSIKGKSSLPLAVAALNHFIKEKKPDDGTADSWGIGIHDAAYFIVSVKKNGNYSVKQSE
ncbi:TPA: hypothetical protein ACSTL5_005029 [Serratia fonticola]